MRYELRDYEWGVIKPMLPNKSRGIPRVDDRRILNGIFWVLRSGAPWRDLPESYGPRTTCYNRFVRWRKAGVWDRLMEAVTAAHDCDVQMIDSSSVRVHQHAANTTESGGDRCMGRSRGGLTTKIHALTDARGLPLELILTPGQAADCPTAAKLLGRLREGTILLADKAYDADWLRRSIEAAGAAPNIPSKAPAAGAPASAPCSTENATSSSGSSTRSNIAAASPRATKSTPPTSSPCLNSLPSASGSGIMSP
jgi:transposase